MHLEVSVQKITQIISAILMTTVASAMQLKAFCSSSLFQTNPAMVDLMKKERVSNHSTAITRGNGGTPLSPLNSLEPDSSIWFMLLEY